MTRARIKYFFI